MELLEDRLGALGGQLVDAATLADLLGVSRDYVYTMRPSLVRSSSRLAAAHVFGLTPRVASRGLALSKTREESVPRQASPQRRKAQQRAGVATARLLL